MTLLALAREHRGALEYDWRARFHVPFSDVSNRMAWGEAYRLLLILLADPSSQIHAACAGWGWPATREWFALRAIHGRLGMFAKGRPPDLPGPWDTGPRRITGGSYSIEEYRDARAVVRG